MKITEFIYTKLLKPKILKASANRVIKFFLPAKVRIEGAIIYLNPNDPVISGALALNVYERDEIEFFKRHITATMNFVDVGANVGLYTGVALASKDFSGTILCMEPHNESRAFLTKTIIENNCRARVVVSEFAASDAEGILTLYKNKENKGDNRLYPDPLLSEHENITVTTLDKICSLNHIDTIDFIKIDVQGAEGKVIAGAMEILGKSEHCIILSEFWPYGLAKAGSDAEGYLNRLQELGFSLFSLGRGASIAPLNIKDLITSTKGRQYTNIVGLKGRYLEP